MAHANPICDDIGAVATADEHETVAYPDAAA
jgi:hypothetical protein